MTRKQKNIRKHRLEQKISWILDNWRHDNAERRNLRRLLKTCNFTQQIFNRSTECTISTEN